MDGVAGYTTYQLKLDLDPATQGNCYTIYGDYDHGAMTFPPAYQVKQRCHAAAKSLSHRPLSFMEDFHREWSAVQEK